MPSRLESPHKVYILYAFWFKTDGGKQRYDQYMQEVLPLIDEAGGQKLKSLVPERTLVGDACDFDADIMYFIEFPMWDAYKAFANSSEYHSIAYMLHEAVEKSLIVKCERPKYL